MARPSLSRLAGALLASALALAHGARAGFVPGPRPARYVTDAAGVLDPARASALNETIARFERDTSNQIVVVVERKVPDNTTLEEWANASYHAWGIGQKGKSNGVLFALFVDDRKMRMEVGRGLEGAIPDALAHRITDEVVKPYFKTGDYMSGIEKGTDAIFAAARGEPYKGTGRTAAETAPTSGGFSFVGVLFLFFLVGILVLVLVVPRMMRARPRSAASGWTSAGGGSSVGGSGWSSSDSSSSSSSSSDSSSSSSDFSGGGGDSGGGGSNDSW